MKNNIIYHNADLDGFCSAAIVKKYLIEKKGVDHDDINMIGWDYHMSLPEIPKGERLWMTDISLPDLVMVALHNEMGSDFTWIDHHKSAIEKSREHGYSRLLGSRMVGDSASLLAWMHLFPERIVPDIVYYVDRYDVWKKDDELIGWSEVMAAQYGMRYYMDDPKGFGEFEQWSSYMDQNSSMMDIISDGKKLLMFEQMQNEIRCKRAFDLVFMDLKFAAVNAFPGGSKVLESYARSDHDALMVFSFNGTGWSFSMYQNEKSAQEIDLSVIAVKMGGGGHAGACGFTVSDIRRVVQTA